MAADGRRHIIAIGGGMLWPEGQIPIHVENALRLTGQREPRLCVVNTAGGDDPRSTMLMYDRLAGHPARVSHLALFPMPNVRDPEDLLLSQHVIFVGGGSVANMLAVWRVHGLDVILRKAWQAGIVLIGSSAGGICWFEGGTTDSFGRELRAFTDGLGLLPGSYCPHYNSEPGRRPLYHRLVADGTLPGGIACDDGAAAHFTDDTLTELIADRPTARAYRVSGSAGPGVTETPLDTRYLGDPALALAGAPAGGGAVQGPGQRGEGAQREQPPGVHPGHVDQQGGDRQRGHHDGGDLPVVADHEVVPERSERLQGPHHRPVTSSDSVAGRGAVAVAVAGLAEPGASPATRPRRSQAA
jgi:peptidase E